MDLTALRSLAARWTDEAALLRRRGAPRQADALESAAEELEARLDTWWLETLTLQEAADEAGLSYSAVQKKVSRGDVPNAGREGSPRVRRCDLFGNGDRPRLEAEGGEPDVAGEILLRRD